MREEKKIEVSQTLDSYRPYIKFKF